MPAVIQPKVQDRVGQSEMLRKSHVSHSGTACASRDQDIGPSLPQSLELHASIALSNARRGRRAAGWASLGRKKNLDAEQDWSFIVTPGRWLTATGLAALLMATCFGVALLLSIRMVRSADYARNAGDPAIELEDAAFRALQQDCDVLIDGDSTAAVGIDPRIVTAQTGLSACNIATSRPVVEDLGTLPLDTYLLHNRKPRLLIIQYGPEEFYPSTRPWQHVGPYTPLAMVARNFTRWQALGVMTKHPAETVQFVYFVLKQGVRSRAADRSSASARYRRALSHALSSHGQLDLDLPGERDCDSSDEPLDGPLNVGRIGALRSRYERQGIAVLIRAAPVPSCDVRLSSFESDLAPYVDGNVEPLPVNFFSHGGRHPTQSGSRLATLGLVNLIHAHGLELPAASTNHAAADAKVQVDSPPLFRLSR